jgi:hypothetical protein
MERHDLPRLVKVMECLCAAFRHTYSEATLEAYFVGLHDTPIDLVEENAILAIRNRTTFPTVSELRRGADYRSPRCRANEAWGIVRGDLQVRGPSRADTLSQHIVATLGGWPRLINANGFDITWIRKEFIELYEQALSDQELERDRQIVRGQHGKLIAGHEWGPTTISSEGTRIVEPQRDPPPPTTNRSAPGNAR